MLWTETGPLYFEINRQPNMHHAPSVHGAPCPPLAGKVNQDGLCPSWFMLGITGHTKLCIYNTHQVGPFGPNKVGFIDQNKVVYLVLC